VAFTSIYRLTHILAKKDRVIHDKTAPSRRRCASVFVPTFVFKLDVWPLQTPQICRFPVNPCSSRFRGLALLIYGVPFLKNAIVPLYPIPPDGGTGTPAQTRGPLLIRGDPLNKRLSITTFIEPPLIQ